MTNMLLSPEQYQEWSRCENSLAALWEWMESLDPDTDQELARIIGDKIDQLHKKVQRRFGIQ